MDCMACLKPGSSFSQGQDQSPSFLILWHFLLPAYIAASPVHSHRWLKGGGIYQVPGVELSGEQVLCKWWLRLQFEPLLSRHHPLECRPLQDVIFLNDPCSKTEFFQNGLTMYSVWENEGYGVCKILQLKLAKLPHSYFSSLLVLCFLSSYVTNVLLKYIQTCYDYQH